MLRILLEFSEGSECDCSDSIIGFCVEYLSQIDPKSAVEQLLRIPGVKDLSGSQSFNNLVENITLNVKLSRILHHLRDFCRRTSESRLPKVEVLISAVFFELLAVFVRLKSDSEFRDAVLLLEMISNFSSDVLLYEGQLLL